MLKKLFHKIVGDPTEKLLGSLQPTVDEVATLEERYSQYSDEALRDETARFRERLAGGETLGDILPEAFALVRETSRRTTGLRH